MKRYLAVLLSGLLFVSGCGERGVSDTADEIYDLTKLSSILAYAEITNINKNPEKYLGRKIKMSGIYFYEPVDEQVYHYLVAEDACCYEVVEFMLAADAAYPEIYEAFTISGVYSSYDELDNTYYYLAADTLTVH